MRSDQTSIITTKGTAAARAPLPRRFAAAVGTVLGSPSVVVGTVATPEVVLGTPDPFPGAPELGPAAPDSDAPAPVPGWPLAEDSSVSDAPGALPVCEALPDSPAGLEPEAPAPLEGSVAVVLPSAAALDSTLSLGSAELVVSESAWEAVSVAEDTPEATGSLVVVIVVVTAFEVVVSASLVAETSSDVEGDEMGCADGLDSAATADVVVTSSPDPLLDTTADCCGGRDAIDDVVTSSGS